VTPETVPSALVRAIVQAGPGSDAGILPIRPDDPFGANLPAIERDFVRSDSGYPCAPEQFDAQIPGSVHEQPVEQRSPDTDSRSMRKARGDGRGGIAVSRQEANAAEGEASLHFIQVQSQPPERCQGIRHQSFAAGLIDRRNGRIR
jgi:hypothetical protein